MIAFIETGNGELVRLDRITEAVSAPHKVGFMETLFVVADGRRYEISRREFDLAIESTRPIIPAAPGYFVLWVTDHLDHLTVDEINFCKEPVIGWRANEYGGLSPVCVERTPIHLMLQRPDGSIVEPDVGQWSDLDAFVRERREVIIKQSKPIA